MESELIIGNYHAFFMLAETTSFTETEIVCCDKALYSVISVLLL